MKTKRIRYKLAAGHTHTYRYRNEPYKLKPYRNEFQRDRDRILYSKGFRRLSGKTQVFLPASHDHVRNRLTHTIEVSQIARVTARCLKLDYDLAEAIALGHDIGHTPFGHVGERALNLVMNGCDQFADFQNKMDDKDKGFKHNLQSLRVACDLEQLYGKPGLNLTNFTLWGIQHHTKSQWNECVFKNSKNGKCMLKKSPVSCKAGDKLLTSFYDKYLYKCLQTNRVNDAWSFEGQVVKRADDIAQRHHDIEDAIFMDLLMNKELLDNLNEFFGSYFDEEDRNIFEKLNDFKSKNWLFLPLISKFIVSFLNKNLIINSTENINNFIQLYSISSRSDFLRKYPAIKEGDVEDLISYEKSFHESDKRLKSFLKNRILNSFDVQRMDGKGSFIIRRLINAYLTNPRQLHNVAIYRVFELFKEENIYDVNFSKTDLGRLRDEIDSTENKANKDFCVALLRAICDHISGMTDNFALNEHKKLYG